MSSNKKEKDSIKLPKAWKSIKNRNNMNQSKSNFEAAGQWIVGIIIVLLLAFILLGGISQKGLIEFAFDWSQTVMTKVSSWIEGGGVEVTDEGIYLNPNSIDNINIPESTNNPNSKENIQQTSQPTETN